MKPTWITSVTVFTLAARMAVLSAEDPSPILATPQSTNTKAFTKVQSKEFAEKYTDSQENQALLEEAIALANTLLGPKSSFVLQASWKPAAVGGKTIIPVFLGKPIGRESYAIAFVPPGEKCIIVEAGELALLDIIMGNRGEQAVKQPLPTCLAIVFLHETGHIALGHSGRLDGARDAFVITKRDIVEAERDFRSRIADAKSAMIDANSKNLEKKQEHDADLFAAKQIKEAGDDTANISRWVKAKSVGSSLPLICFNLGTARMFKAFDVDNLMKLNRNDVYWDKDVEHPNFELRMLRINAFLAINTEAEAATKKLVEDFEARRTMIEYGLILPRLTNPPR